VAERKTLSSSLIRNARVSSERFTVGHEELQGELAARFIPEEEHLRIVDQLEREKKEAYSRGFTDGDKAGTTKGMDEARKVAERFSLLVSQVEAQRTEILRQAESEVAGLAMAIARRVIGVKAELDDELVLDAVRKSARLLLDRSQLTVKVAPEQHDFLKHHLDDLYAIDDRIQRISVEENRRVRPGGCILETDSGNVDARIESELQNIEKIIRNVNLQQADD
jgi:flagellar assembly protein FliH